MRVVYSLPGGLIYRFETRAHQNFGSSRSQQLVLVSACAQVPRPHLLPSHSANEKQKNWANERFSSVARLSCLRGVKVWARNNRCESFMCIFVSCSDWCDILCAWPRCFLALIQFYDRAVHLHQKRFCNFRWVKPPEWRNKPAGHHCSLYCPVIGLLVHAYYTVYSKKKKKVYRFANFHDHLDRWMGFATRDLRE